MASKASHAQPPVQAPAASSPFLNDGAADGQEFIPADGTGTRTMRRTEVPSIAPFMLKHHPKRWTVMGGKVIPAFGRLKFIPGVNGCNVSIDRAGVETVQPGQARLAAEEAGWIMIPFASTPPTHGLTSYLWKPSGRPDLCLLRYERVYTDSDTIECDEVRYLEFCQYQIDSGVIKPPAPHVLRRMRDDLQQRFEAASDKAATVPSYKSVAARLAKDVAAIEAELAKRTETARPVADGDTYSPDGG